MPRSHAGEPESMTVERKAELLASAITIFASRGVKAASLSDIARQTRVSVPTLERAVGSKEQLFRSAVREVARIHVTRACRELPPGPAVEQLRNFCGRSWEILHTPTYAALYRLWVTEIPRYPDLARFYADEVYGPVHDLLVGIIERGIAEGQFRPVVPGTAARVIMAALAKQAFWCNHGEAFGPALGSGCNRVVAETLSILLGGLQPPRQDSTS
jgi:AcrR family transcriptional regulator